MKDTRTNEAISLIDAGRKLVRELIDEMRREWAELDARIAALDREFVETVRASAPAPAPARRLATIPGIGALNATALTAAIKLGQRDENAGKTIVVVLPDSGERYLSSILFEGVFDAAGLPA
mgnify:CR=1 FL=1